MFEVVAGEAFQNSVRLRRAQFGSDRLLANAQADRSIQRKGEHRVGRIVRSVRSNLQSVLLSAASSPDLDRLLKARPSFPGDLQRKAVHKELSFLCFRCEGSG